MNERQISEKESLAIIEEMICRTRRRLDIGAGNQMLLWGYLTLGVAVLTTAAIIFLRTPHASWLGFLLSDLLPHAAQTAQCVHAGHVRRPDFGRIVAGRRRSGGHRFAAVRRVHGRGA